MAKILIVDDEESVRRLIKRLLERNGYACIPAPSAAEARVCLRDQDFDLLLCDIMMPGESGIDFIRHVRAEYPDTAIIMVTAIEDPQTAKTALEIGIYGYIIKPFDENQILISVANALRRRELEMKERSHRKDLEKAVRQRTAELLKTNEQLRNRKAELQTRTEELKEVNSALRVLLKRREEDKAELEEKVLSNMRIVACPYLEKLKQSGLNDKQMTYLNLLESNINDIVSPMVRELSSSYLDLTPTEIQTANLIKQGKTTKEISAILNLSENTIMSHRYKIRSKLGLLKKKMNLQTFLQSLK
ncbi:MAG: response regulator [Pseudomonadota bacterium]